MSDIKLSYRYAKSFFDFSKEKNTIATIFNEVLDLKGILEENQELVQFFDSPLYDSEKKIGVINSLFKDFSADTKNFLTLLSNKGRLNLLNEIIVRFVELNNAETDKNIVTLTLAEHLSDNLVENIIEKGKQMLNFEGKKIEIKKNIDPTIIGGFILQIKDKQLNASIKNRLADLKNHFNLNLYESKL